MRETQHPISDNAMTSFLHNALSREIVKREYHREIMQGQAPRDALPNYYEIREIVERKWELEHELLEKEQLLLAGQGQQQALAGPPTPGTRLTQHKPVQQ